MKNINTVCKSARCPNVHDCFSRKKCTFLILGDHCTRSCRFCSMEKAGKPKHSLDGEIGKIKEAIKILEMRRVTLTSVTRDDLSDGGASHFAKCVRALKEMDPGLVVEVLVPDFLGREKSIEEVMLARPDVFSHNVETVPRLYKKVRPQADYVRSLKVLKISRDIADEGTSLKSGLMVGLGEEREEVFNVMQDIRNAGCDTLTIGQYLKPDKDCLDVEKYIEPKEFLKFSEWAEDLGFKKYSCTPFTRSSYLE